MARNLLLILPLLAVAGCATPQVPEPKVVTVEVPVPTPAPCVPKELKDTPAYVDTDADLKAAPDAASRYQLLYAGRKQRNARLSELEPIVVACPREK